VCLMAFRWLRLDLDVDPDPPFNAFARVQASVVKPGKLPVSDAGLDDDVRLRPIVLSCTRIHVLRKLDGSAAPSN